MSYQFLILSMMVTLKKNISISENGFLFDANTGDSYSLNETAADILLLLEEGKDENVLMQEFQKKYNVDDLSFERSYFDFINLLRHLNLILEHN